MSISKLVNGETIQIDNHNAGQAIDINDEGLHLHKRNNDKSGSKGYADVIIPLNKGEIKVHKAKGGKDKGRNDPSIVSEIKTAFKDPQIRQKFCSTLNKELPNLAKYNKEYSDKEHDVLNNEGKAKVNESIIRVAELFSMTENDVRDYLYLDDKRQVIRFSNINNLFPKTLYVEANLRKGAYIITQAKYMLGVMNAQTEL